MLLEVFAEERLGREIEVVSDFLDTHSRIFQQRFGLEDHRLVDPARSSFAADFLDDR